MPGNRKQLASTFHLLMDYSKRMKRHGRVTGRVTWASLQTAWCSSGIFIVVTGETPAAALLLKKRTGWPTCRPSGQGAKGMRLGVSSPQEMLHGFQLGVGLMGGKRVVSLGKLSNPDGSKVLIVLNSASSSKTFTVRWSSKSFTSTLPSGAVATFTGAGTPSAQTARSP